ncbi:Riboflavin synthase eubacterial/eukaryotic [hydrothermal vent metagenome]|uniref:Riboflavin synthase n=1 Tax=hydrothermal vent metagenome TaxID=652676 RepID=A0A1W1BNJ1_9ZZZZ
MFTGLIREIATVKSFVGSKLTLKAKYKPGIGDSIAINGACLTVTELLPDGFSVELSPESQSVLAIENYKDQVHIEPAMAMGDRFEGHIVQGHVDTIGEIEKITKSGNSYDLFVSIDKQFIPYIVPKGSITIDGVSLTVNEVFEESFRLTIIPHTMQETLFKNYKKGTRVNIETDMFARYIEHILSAKERQKTPTWSEVDKISALF